MVDVARNGDDHPLRDVAPDVEGVQLRARHRRHRVDAADHRAPDRMVTEHGREEHVTEGVLGIVVAHGDLLEHHVAFEFDVMGLATTPQHHIGNQVDGQFQIVVEHMRVVAGVLLGGERVELTADRVDGLRDLHRGARRGRLEQQVFQEVRGTGDGRALVT